MFARLTNLGTNVRHFYDTQKRSVRLDIGVAVEANFPWNLARRLKRAFDSGTSAVKIEYLEEPPTKEEAKQSNRRVRIRREVRNTNAESAPRYIQPPQPKPRPVSPDKKDQVNERARKDLQPGDPATALDLLARNTEFAYPDLLKHATRILGDKAFDSPRPHESNILDKLRDRAIKDDENKAD
jgi:hypothetical protein